MYNKRCRWRQDSTDGELIVSKHPSLLNRRTWDFVRSTPHLFSVAAGCNVQNYTDPVTMEHCRLAGLLDLNQTNPAVAHGEFAAFEMTRPAAASPA